jgi:oligopeptidase A
METSWSAVSHLKAVKDHEELRAAVDAVQPQIVAFGLKTGQSYPIYKQYKSTLATHGKELSEAQLRIVEKGIQGAEHAGVALEGARACTANLSPVPLFFSSLLFKFSPLFSQLPGESKARFNAIAEQLAHLSTTFTNNVLDATKAFSLLLTSPEQVAGLPSSALGMFAQAAKSKGHADASAAAGPWLVTLDAPSYMPIMQHAKDRSRPLSLFRCYCRYSSLFSAVHVQLQAAARDRLPRLHHPRLGSRG